ncbi:hemolysin family protein [Paenibacillus lentus]|uniref:HlyC/CorC family transporter n=1 Tax=Paenibacillus lentus TaxID=1338368 RepID=A0A3Q8S5P0_9BACL|nr:hemolysin family protein [Paenibacillus lentus]AZK47571.1 HlyC/CorC family transporter [Paenibacillus lentus]
MTFEVIVLIVLILVNAFFAASEISLISINDNKIRLLAKEGNRKAAIIHKLVSEPSGFLATIQIGITLAGFLASAFAADSFSSILVDYLLSLGMTISPALLDKLAVIAITLILSYFTLVFGELVPKRLAMKKPEPIAMLAAIPLNALSIVASPFVKLLTASTNVVVRLFGVDPNAEDEEASEEEIRMLVDAGLERGTIQQSERRIIHNLFDFDDKTASELMTHRVDMKAIHAGISRDEIIKVVASERFTRFPVYDEGLDSIIGILHVKDLIRYLTSNEEGVWDIYSILRSPYFVTESKKGDELLEELQQNREHMAVVIDEYGGTAGIVTMEDLIEDIVGHIFDEHDEKETDYEQVDENTHVFLGTCHLDEVNEILNTNLPEGSYDTLSGFVIGTLGRIPAMQEQPEFEFNGYLFKVAEVGKRRIHKIRVTKKVQETKN